LAKSTGTDNLAETIIQMSEDKRIKLPEARERTQLDAVKDYLKYIAESNGYQKNHQLWMPVLPSYIYMQEFAEYQNEAFAEGTWKSQSGSWSLEIPIGKLDDPQNQAQVPLHFSFSEGGHHAIIGSVVSGKSTMIQTILYGMVTKYSPEYVNVYALDFSSKMMSAFEGLAHFGGIMYEGDDEKIAKFFNMIERILNERKRVFRGGNYNQYVQVHGMEFPAIIIAIDNYSAFKEKTEDRYEKLMIQLSKEGVGHGIFLLVSAGGFGMNEIPGRIAENFKTVLCLELPDKYAYGDVLHTTQIQVLPEAGIKGRGLAVYGSRVLEYQTALALKAEDDYQRMERISELCMEMNQSWKGKRAQPVPEIPKKPEWQTFIQLPDVTEAVRTDYLLPVGYNFSNAEVYSVDLSQIYCYLISGAAKTGKKNFMKAMIESARMKKSKICLIDGDGVMKQYASQEDITYVHDFDELFTYFQDTLTPEFVRRNVYKKQILEEGLEEEELYKYTRKQTPMFIFISDMLWFIRTIYDGQNSLKGTKQFMETLTSKGRYHNIYFVGILNMDDKNVVKGYQTFLNFASYKTGIHFGGNVMQNGFLNFDYLPFKEQTKTEKTGIGQLPEMDGEVSAAKIVVPLVGKIHKGDRKGVMEQ
jgi:S-DNA-T family DNA segregation ATPase FtsK/SpoIIIE